MCSRRRRISVSDRRDAARGPVIIGPRFPEMLFRRDHEESVRLAVIRGKLGEELVDETPAEAVSSVSMRILARISSAILVAEAMPIRFSVTLRYVSASGSGLVRGGYSAKPAR